MATRTLLWICVVTTAVPLGATTAQGGEFSTRESVLHSDRNSGQFSARMLESMGGGR